MLYEPSYTQPNLSSIDVLLANTFSCMINTSSNTTVSSYRLKINDLDGNNKYDSERQYLANVLYNGDKLEVTIPIQDTLFNGVDYVWNIALYSNVADIFVTSGKVQSGSTTTTINIRKHYNVIAGMYIKIGNQIKQINTYSQDTGVATVDTAFTTAPSENTTYYIYSDYVNSSDIFFKARKTPTLAISSITSPITSKKYNFIGTYTQENGVGWKYFEWHLYDVNGNLLKSSGQINAGVIQYEFNGLSDNTSYKVELILENQDGIMLSEDSTFSVNYAEPDLAIIPDYKVLYDKNAIEVSWNRPYINLGTASGESGVAYDIVSNYPYIGGKCLELNDDNNIYWQPSTTVKDVPIPYMSSVCLHVKFPSGFSGDIIKLETLPITLLSISEAVLPCNQGDKYYNSTDKKIYTATSSNTWGTVGVDPLETDLYKVGDTKYLFNGYEMEENDIATPFYRVWYEDGYFFYEINNNWNICGGLISVLEPFSEWLLQEQFVDSDRPFVWDDDSEWDDTLYWTEQEDSLFDRAWFKITLLPTQVNLLTIPINRPSAFREEDSDSIYSSALYSDYNLITTDVLYK